MTAEIAAKTRAIPEIRLMREKNLPQISNAKIAPGIAIKAKPKASKTPRPVTYRTARIYAIVITDPTTMNPRSPLAPKSGATKCLAGLRESR